MYEYPSNFCLNLIPKPAGEPVFLVFSEHITSWYNDDRAADEEYTQVEVTYPRWKFLPQSSINYIIQGGQILALTDDEKMIKSLALQGEQDPADPKPPAKKKSPVPGPSKPVVKSDTPGSSKPTPSTRKSGNTPKGNSTTVNKKVKTDSPATTPSDNKAEIIELRRLLRETESDLQSARLKVGRLEDQAGDLKTAYEEDKTKMEDTIGDYDDLIELKRATYNHFLSKWENDNISNSGDDVTPLKNAFPVTLRKYFLKDIENDKNALD
jgi:hypothetical protein